jgi:predicted nucleotidyltransferase
MPLPALDNRGDLPVGVHQATLTEVLARFGYGTPQRKLVTARLLHIYELARRTGKLQRFIIFGSYVTDKAKPNDIDIPLIMTDDFEVPACDEQTQSLFDHLRAQEIFGASVFSIRPSTAFRVSVDEFIAGWQIKRDQSRHGIIEVIPEQTL